MPASSDVKTSLTAHSVSKFANSADVNDQLGCKNIQGFHVKKLTTGTSYRLRYRDNAGKRRTIKIGDFPAMKPVQAANKAMKWIIDGTDPLEEKRRIAREIREKAQEKARQQYLRLGNYFEIYKVVIADSPDVLRKIEVEFGHLFDRDMDKITSLDITSWYNKRRKQGLKRTTLIGYFGAFKAMLNYAAGSKKGEHNDAPILSINPLHNYTLPKPTKVERQQALAQNDEMLTKRDIFSDDVRVGIANGLAAYAENIRKQRRSSRQHGKSYLPDLDNDTYPHWFIPFVEIARLTGMRPGDIYALKWQNIHKNDLQRTQTLVFVPQKTQHKGDNPITVKFPVPKELKNVLDTWSEQQGNPTTGLLFKSTRTGRELERKSHLRHWNHIKQLGGLPKELQFYSFRHNFISSLVREGVPLIKIAKLVGHADTTMIVKNYLRTDEEDLLGITELASLSWATNDVIEEQA